MYGFTCITVAFKCCQQHLPHFAIQFSYLNIKYYWSEKKKLKGENRANSMTKVICEKKNEPEINHNIVHYVWHADLITRHMKREKRIFSFEFKLLSLSSPRLKRLKYRASSLDESRLNALHSSCYVCYTVYTCISEMQFDFRWDNINTFSNIFLNCCKSAWSKIGNLNENEMKKEQHENCSIRREHYLKCGCFRFMEFEQEILT